MHILFIAGEISGDFYGQALVKAIKKLSPNCTLSAIGGPQLKKTVDTFIYSSVEDSTIGLWETLKKKHKHQKMHRALAQFLDETPIDKAVIIDLQHQNNAIAKRIHAYNIPIYTYITPNFWIWQDVKKAKQLCRYSKEIFTIFNREYDFYTQFSSHIHYFGNPLFSPKSQPSIPTHTPCPTVALFPGSREQEIHYNIGIMCETARLLQSTMVVSLQCIISQDKFMPEIKSAIASKKVGPIALVTEDQDHVFNTADLIICAAGTTSLNAVAHHIPVIVLSALSPISYAIAKWVLRLNLPYTALPNIISGQEIVPEFIQNERNPIKIAEKARDLLNPKNKSAMLSKYDTIRSVLTPTSDPFEAAVNVIINT